MAEENKLEVEETTGKEDPFREWLKTDLSDPAAFSRNAMGTPKGDFVKMEELVLWFLDGIRRALPCRSDVWEVSV